MYDKSLVLDIVYNILDALKKVESRCSLVKCSDDFFKNDIEREL